MEIARIAFYKLRQVLGNRGLTLKLTVPMAKCYVFSIPLKGLEGQTLTENLSTKLEAFEMWVHKRNLNLSSTVRVSNTDILNRMGRNRDPMRNEKYRIFQLVMQGKIEGKGRPGRRKTSWLKNLREWYGRSTRFLFRAAASKVQIAMRIASAFDNEFLHPEEVDGRIS